MVAALVTYFAVRVADKPADSEHPYGHSKIENFSALIETVILLATCGWIVMEAVERLTTGAVHMQVTVWSFLVMILSIVVDYSRSRALMKVAKKYNSQALEADALHFSTDIYSSLVVMVGLAGALYGIFIADVIAALIVAVIVILICVRMIRRTFDALIDTSPAGMRDKIMAIVLRQPGVLSCKSLRVRQSGMYTFCDMVIGVDRRFPFETVHEILDRLEQSVRRSIPHCDLRVHAEPEIGMRETLMDKVKLAVMTLGYLPHNVEIFQLEDGRCLLDLHVESAGRASLAEAHHNAETIRSDLQRRFPQLEYVTAHLEQEREGIQRYREVTAERGAMVQEIGGISLSMPHVKACGDIRVFESEGRCKLLFVVTVEKSMPLEDVHRIVTDIEKAIQRRMPEVGRIVIHAEPG
jgi:cation diffusion facilitator family transporter